MAKQIRKVRPGNRGTHRKPARTRHMALDERARDILQLTALLLARCNYSRAEMQQGFEQALASTPEWIGARVDGIGVSNHIIGEVLTRWFLLPRYSLNGQPRPLPFEGRLSLTSLIRSISRRFDPRDIRDELIRTQSVRFEKGVYLAQERNLHVRHDPRLLSRHHLQIVRQLLRTVEGNARGQEDLRRFEFVTTGLVPREHFADFAAAQGKSALNFLFAVDREFVSHSDAPIPRSDVIEMSVGVVFSDDRPLPPLTAPTGQSVEETDG